LKSLSGKVRLGDISLYALLADELIERHRIVMHAEEPDLATEETIKFLNR